MSAFLRIVALLVFVAGIVSGLSVYFALDLSQTSTEQDFVSMMLRSEPVTSAADGVRTWLCFFIIITGFTLGSLCLGTAEILRRIGSRRHEERDSES
jgi:TRAP-type mannitol/chloroaromatic compound transport system permease small subunit